MELQRTFEKIGDKLRQYYQQLSADPKSFANLDQYLPNYVHFNVKIHPLPQDWFWCDSWCLDETKVQAKAIDLCLTTQNTKNRKFTWPKESEVEICFRRTGLNLMEK